MKVTFFNRNFFLLWQGQLVSQVGSQAFLVATMYWTMQTTGSASLMGIVMMLATLPMVVLSPIGGTVADWYARRTIIIISDLLSGLSVLSLAGVLLWRPADTDLIVAWLCGVVLLSGTIRAFFQPDIMATIPDLVSEDRVASANAMMQFSAQASIFVGQGLGGVLYRVLGAPVLFIIDGISYLFSAFSEIFIQLPTVERTREASTSAAFATFWNDTRTGFHYVWQHVGMRNLLLAASLVNFCVMPVFVLLPFYVELQLGVGVAWYGFLLAAIGAGSILGYGLAGAWTVSGTQQGILLRASLLGVTVLIGLLAIVTLPFVALALMLAVGVLSGFINIHVLTLFQTRTPKAIRGRVLSLVVTLASAVTPLGMLLGGVLGDLTGKNLPLIYAASGIGATLVMSLIAFNRDLHTFLVTDPDGTSSGFH